MDAAERAELDGLRRRAYGVESDIHDDPAALARLIELEDLARPEPPTAEPAAAPGPEPVLEVEPEPVEPESVAPEAVETPAPPAPARTRTAGVRTALLTSAVAVAAIVAAAALLQPPAGEPSAATPSVTPKALFSSDEDSEWIYAGDPDAQRLMTISLDSSYTNYVDWPTDRPIPQFPSANPLKWATPIGRYYGWSLWVAGGGDFPVTEHCILIERGSVMRARCLDGRRQAA